MNSALLRFRYDPGRTMLRHMQRLGLHPGDVRHIIMTHLDFDHAGGLVDFPEATVHVMAAEAAAAQAREGVLGRARYRPVQWGDTRRWRTYPDRPDGSWYGFDAVLQLDGLPQEFVLVPLPGHSAGHAGVAIETPRGWMLHAGRHLLQPRRDPRGAAALPTRQRRLRGGDGLERATGPGAAAAGPGTVPRHGRAGGGLLHPRPGGIRGVLRLVRAARPVGEREYRGGLTGSTEAAARGNPEPSDEGTSMANWHRVAAEADLTENMPLAVRIGDLQVAVVRLEDGIFAVNDVCTHEYALLSDGYCEEGKLECPLHQACFDIRTGAALNEPAEVPVATYRVKVEAGAVFVEA